MHMEIINVYGYSIIQYLTDHFHIISMAAILVTVAHLTPHRCPLLREQQSPPPTYKHIRMGGHQVAPTAHEQATGVTSPPEASPLPCRYILSLVVAVITVLVFLPFSIPSLVCATLAILTHRHSPVKAHRHYGWGVCLWVAALVAAASILLFLYAAGLLTS